jgi:hypothetical protein
MDGMAPGVDLWSPLPVARSQVNIARWEVDAARRLPPGGGVNGQAGDHWPGPPFLTTTDMPYQWMPYALAYGLRMNGSPLQHPTQPYRAGAGTLYGSNAAMFPQPLAHGNLSRFYHLFGGSKSGGVQAQGLSERLAAARMLLASRGRKG